MTLDQWRDLCRLVLEPYIGDDCPTSIVKELANKYPGRGS